LVERALAGGKDVVADQPLPGPGWRYVDFLTPGLIALGLMGGGLVGVGFVLVDLRRRGLLKRFLASPIRRQHVLLAVLLSRLIFLIPEVALLLGVSYFVFGVTWQGNTVALLTALVTSASVFMGLGLLLAARIEALEAISGWISVLMLVQWFLCGVFFPTKVYPEWLQPWLEWLPLTPVVTGLREVFMEPDPWKQLAPELLRMALWAGGTSIAGLILFSWGDR
jgi:ABC-type multidrug transport system permease subunit